MTSIHCIKPGCQTVISVPPGATTVNCPVCHTLHFPSQGEEQGSFSGNYGLPPSTTQGSEGSSASIPPYDPHPWPPERGDTRPTPSEPEQKGNTSLGFLALESGRQFPLKVGKNVIGRKVGDILLDDTTVSRKHCIIEVTPKPAGGGWDYALYDIGHVDGNSSANGVFVKGRSQRLQTYERIQIGEGTVIQLGNVQVMLRCFNN
jgi:LSD1 subclass zinc finger protein